MNVTEVKTYGLDILDIATNAKMSGTENSNHNGVKFTKDLNFILSNIQVVMKVDAVTLFELMFLKDISSAINIASTYINNWKYLANEKCAEIVDGLIHLAKQMESDTDVTENYNDPYNLLPTYVILSDVILSFTGPTLINILGITNIEKWNTLSDDNDAINKLIKNNFYDMVGNKYKGFFSSIDILSSFSCENKFYKNLTKSSNITLAYTSTDYGNFSFLLDDKLRKLPKEEALKIQKDSLNEFVRETPPEASVKYSFVIKSTFKTFISFYLAGVVTSYNPIQETLQNDTVVLGEIIRNKYQTRATELISQLKDMLTKITVTPVLLTEAMCSGQLMKYTVTIPEGYKIKPITNTDEETKVLQSFIDMSIEAFNKMRNQ